MATIRRASVHDVPGIAPLLEEVFAGVKIDRDYCRELIAAERQSVHIATQNEQVVGVVAGFVTHAGGGVKRWEVDVLAVREPYWGRGIAGELLEATWGDADANSVKFVRGLVRVENQAAQRAFEKAGYTTSGQVYDLLIWQPAVAEVQFPARSLVHATPVETLIYRGLWLEGLESPMLSDEERQTCIAGARAQAAREGRAHTSSLIPADKPLAAEVQGSAQVMGQYQWWRKP